MCDGMVSWFQRHGGYTLLLQNPQGTKQYKKTFGKKAKKREDIINQQPLSGGGGGGKKGGAPEGGYIKRVTGDEREEEMDQNLT